MMGVSVGMRPSIFPLKSIQFDARDWMSLPETERPSGLWQIG